MLEIINNINPALPENVQNLLHMGLAGARMCFEQDKEVKPFMAFAKDKALRLCAVTTFGSESEKDSVVALMARLRRDNDAVMFITECWMSKSEVAPGSPGYVMPSKDPNHTEVLQVALYARERTIIFQAPITREPDALGSWGILMDSAANDPERQMEGRFVDLTPNDPDARAGEMIPLNDPEKS